LRREHPSQIASGGDRPRRGARPAPAAPYGNPHPIRGSCRMKDAARRGGAAIDLLVRAAIPL
jgi:hypothetical protein